MKKMQGLLAALVVLAVSGAAYAEPLVDFTTATTDIDTNKAGYITAGLAVFGLLFAVRVAKRLFKSAAR